MQVPRGPTTILFRGRSTPREQGFADLSEIVCPAMHRMKLGGFTIRGDGGLTCHNKATQGGAECGAVLWLLQVPANRHMRRFYVADVEYRELELWEQRGYVAEDVLRYLGAWFSRADDPPVDRALRRRSA